MSGQVPTDPASLQADLSTAFHKAIVAYIAWSRDIDIQAAATCKAGPCCDRHWLCPCQSRNLLVDYHEEPQVIYNGQSLPISDICRLAAVLTGDLPPVIADLIQYAVVEGMYRDLTYPSAVETMNEYIRSELDRVRLIVQAQNRALEQPLEPGVGELNAGQDTTH